MEYDLSHDANDSRYGLAVSESIFRAWLAHPCYSINKDPAKYIAYLKDPLGTLKSARIKHQQNENSVRRIVALDQILSFQICRWIGDLPNLEEIAQHEKNSGVPCVVAVNAVLSNDFKKKWAGKVYELGAPWASTYIDTILTEFENYTVEKDFACFINRLDPNRQSWFYLLIQKNMLDQGFVSFNLDTARSEYGVATLQPLDAFESLYQRYMSNFFAEHKVAKQIIPYRNFPADENLDAVIMKSRFNIILETYFSFNDQIMITEKTIRSLRLPRPWLLYGAAGNVAQLRKWGFDTLDDLVDHSQYDDIEHPIERQTKILDLAQQLLNFDTVEHWDRLKMAALFNNEVLLRWKKALPQTAFDEFYQILDDYAIRNNLSAK